MIHRMDHFFSQILIKDSDNLKHISDVKGYRDFSVLIAQESTR